ncbi:NAD-dependent epimerase/dehydratase family protein [Vibrio sp. ZSDZ65]|uniref:NAD-dependent epimerase/dehydratase family protein n=1 Tax=Vibrio qingdaonensis TaxID=2829491 RepID=A0A9X3CRM9_9VIBR|nr:NAD-dependent epimerase/dehydratase family protein [Vibrio qingdaonensis]MCW8348145.1 NAD-dependent epimerase/dehydratase family protein [Vibrio qingdaonensis]
MKRIAVTGTTGFLGGALLHALKAEFHVDVVSMKRRALSDSEIELDLSTHFQVEQALHDKKIDVLVHCAARAHILDDKASNPLDEYRKINTLATIQLAEQAAAAGVTRFVFISTAKVNGELSQPNHTLTEVVTDTPQDPYAMSKYEAEVALQQIAKKTGMDVVVVRPPLVYGVGVKANFAALMKLSQTSMPLPFGGINNRRSLVFLDNLVDAIICCTSHPLAANQTFLVTDDDDVSTTQLLRILAQAYNKHITLLSIPTTWLTRLLRMLGKKNMAERLFGSLQFDISHIKQTLKWTPPYSFEQGIQKTIKDSKTQ